MCEEEKKNPSPPPPPPPPPPENKDITAGDLLDSRNCFGKKEE